MRRAFQSAGVYTVRIESRYYQPLEADIELPMPDRRVPAFFDLAPGYLYPFPRSRLPGGGGPTLLRGRVVDGAHQGIERITIQVVGQETIAYFTDNSGQWILVFPDTQPSGLVSLRFLRPDTTSEIVNAISIEQGTESSLAPVVLVP